MMQVGAKVLQKNLSALRGEEPREVARDRIYRGWFILGKRSLRWGQKWGQFDLVDQNNKKASQLNNCEALCLLVGTVGFELTTPWTPSKCATRLRYAPKCNIIAVFFYKANQLPL